MFIAFPCSPYPDVLQNPGGNASQLPLFTFPVNYGPMIFCSVKAETSEFTGSLVSPYGETPWQMHLAPAALITQGRLSAEPNQASLSGQAESNFFCKKKAEQHPTPGPHLAFFFFFSFGMIINLWQIPQLHAAQSRLTRKKKQLSQWRNVPQRFTRFPVFFEFGNYILFHAVCTLLSRWKHAGLGSVCASTCACAQERKVKDGSAMGWS